MALFTATAARDTFADTREGALALIEYVLDEAYRTALLAVIEDGAARLVPDPEVSGVWGVLDARGKAKVVLYTAEADFEADEEWLDFVTYA
jgi:hypothetical protein